MKLHCGSGKGKMILHELTQLANQICLLHLKPPKLCEDISSMDPNKIKINILTLVFVFHNLDY